MQLITESRRYRLTGLSPLLATQPPDKDIRTKYIGSRAPAPWQSDEENEHLPDEGDVFAGVTVFHLEKRDNTLYLMDYMISGFLSEAVDATSAYNGVKMANAKVKKYCFPFPRFIPILRDGVPLTEVDENFERPLRRDPMVKGPRTTLAASECINDPWTLEIGIELVQNNGTTASKPITWDTIELALDYGSRKGLGQWRNGRFGRFTWEPITEVAHPTA